MAGPLRPDNAELDTWQEIAAYLGVSVREAQYWEKDDGMPVHRMPGKRSRVKAYPAELEAWKTRVAPARDVTTPADHDEAAPGSDDAIQPEETRTDSAPRPIKRRAWLLGWIAGTTALSAVAAGLLRAFGAREVADVAVEGSALVARDASGRELWRHLFERGLHAGDYAADAIHHTYWIGDLDGDGASEVLFVASPADLGSASSSLFCFARSGRVKWVFRVGRVVRDASGDIRPLYCAHALSVVPSRGPSRERRVALASGHATDQACQIALLDAGGRLVGEYWHPGSLFWLREGRPARDGAPRVLAAGVNNGEHRATLVALDPFAIVGASTPWRMADQRFRMLDMPEAHEEAVILFPRTCLGRAEPYTRSVSLDVAEDYTVRVRVAESYDPESARLVFYEFDPELRLRKAFLSSAYRAEHLEKERSGELRHPWQEDEAALAQRLEYRRGKP